MDNILQGSCGLRFFRGAELASKLLEDTGEGVRHIKIANEEGIPAEEIARSLAEATKLKNKKIIQKN